VTPPPEGEPTPPPESDRRWPAWLIDGMLAAAGAKAISAALRTIGLGPLVRAFLSWARKREKLNGAPVTPGAVRTWLGGTSRGRIAAALERALRPALNEIYRDATSYGREAALAVLAHGAPLVPGVEITVDWGAFVPGHPEAALKADASRVKGIVGTQLDAIARELTEGLLKGETPEQIGRRLETLLEDPVRALTIAWTETNRALSAAAIDTYREQGVTTKGWMTALDQRVCPVCVANEVQGFIPIGDDFRSGDPHPPGHPRCRCAPIPGPIEENEP